MTQSLTLLQRAVVIRLCDAGFTGLASMASHEWSQEKQILVVDSMAIGEPHGELCAEFIRANKQAGGATAKD
jgi:hypothetical protein